MFARGSTIKTVTIKEFKDFEIPIPALEIQKHIVSKLDKINLIQNELQFYLNELCESRKSQQILYSNRLLNMKEGDYLNE